MEPPGCVSEASHVTPSPSTWVRQALVQRQPRCPGPSKGPRTPPPPSGGPSRPRCPEASDRAAQHVHGGSCEQKEVSTVQQKLTQSCKAIIFPPKTRHFNEEKGRNWQTPEQTKDPKRYHTATKHLNASQHHHPLVTVDEPRHHHTKWSQSKTNTTLYHLYVESKLWCK